MTTAAAVAVAAQAGAATVSHSVPSRGASASAGAPRLVLPPPGGAHQIGTVALHLVDSARRDPYDPARRPRELMVQLWYPAAHTGGYPRAPWLSPQLAAEAFADPRIRPPVTHGHSGAPVDRRGGTRPVVLYSHGFGGHRGEATALVEELVSRGYVVATIDHPYDAVGVEFPGGRVVPHTMEPPNFDDPADPVATRAVAVRAADARFVLDRLTALNAGRNPDAAGREVPVGLRGALSLSRVAMVGHSLGGAATLAAMRADRRIRAGVNLDGALFGPVLASGLNRPVLLLGSTGHDRHTDPSWAAVWPKLRGGRLNLELAGSGHASFTDAQVLDPQAAKILGIPREQLTPGIGTIDGPRSVAVQRAYLSAFLDAHLRDGPRKLVSGPSPRYPEMVFP
ncbi:alpha/beta hydrolase family protein [Actinoplanes sp. NPDC051859]|uniref:alpha/beta hydrolase family protein n=1 Tax=Actinoplanes sp. NPDC051859 TaxID=3363909 RepID=UPI003797D48B